MKKNLFCFLMLFSLAAFSQIKFENAYYVNNDGEKISGLIKNYDWKNNPTSFEFKTSEDSEVEIINIDFAKEFNINNNLRYLRAEVDIEKSSLKTAHIGTKKEPDFVKQTLFLKQLASGSNNLYKYEENGIEKFFYSTENSKIKQLIYIKYMPSEEEVRNNPEINRTSILSNEQYKRQLWYDVKCETTSQKELNSLDYNEPSLIKYFNQVNNCDGNVSDEIKSENKGKANFNFKVSAAYNISNMEVHDYFAEDPIVFKGSNFGIGFESEIILPYNNNKWSVIIEPSYNVFKETSNSSKSIFTTSQSKLDLKYLQIPFGIRHYFFIDSKSRIFLNALGNVRVIGKKSHVNYSNHEYNIFGQTSFAFAGGIGYNYDKFSLEARYITPTNLSNSNDASIDFNNISFILRYEVF